jgi:diaminopimelate epimerase
MVRMKMRNVDKVEVHSNHYILNTGSPHYIKSVADVTEIDVKNSGHTIRYSKEFADEGINVNFVQSLDEDAISVRTYERGVEDETLSCGTGVTASALISAHNDNGFNRVEVTTPGGNLSVDFEKLGDERFENIWLSGPVEFVYKGEITI